MHSLRQSAFRGPRLAEITSPNYLVYPRLQLDFFKTPQKSCFCRPQNRHDDSAMIDDLTRRCSIVDVAYLEAVLLHRACSQPFSLKAIKGVKVGRPPAAGITEGGKSLVLLQEPSSLPLKLRLQNADHRLNPPEAPRIMQDMLFGHSPYVSTKYADAYRTFHAHQTNVDQCQMTITVVQSTRDDGMITQERSVDNRTSSIFGGGGRAGIP